MVNRSELINQIREKVYFYLDGHAGPKKAYGSYNALPPRFDQDLMNDIAALKSSSSDTIVDDIANIRGKIEICVTTGFLGEKDAEEIHQLLDKLTDKEE